MAGGGLVGCRDKNVTNTFIQQALFPTRADAIATPVSDSWHDPTGSSINPARNEHLDRDDFRVFRGRDGSGLVAFLERNVDLYLAYYGPSGAIGQPVRIRGDYTAFLGKNLDAAVCVWTPQGDAVIAFIAKQFDDPLVTDDLSSNRVYYTTFRRSLAAVSHAASGEEYGFETRAVPIDTNVIGSDDNNVVTLFVASDLIDGSVEFSGSSKAKPEHASGDPGDAAANHGGHFIFLGWVHENAAGYNRAEGAFVGLDSAQTSYLAMGSLQTVTTSPALLTGENLSATVLTSGRDIIFRWQQKNGSGTQERLSLVRINATRDGLDPGIDVGRGDATSGTTSSIAGLDHTTFVGDGYRALNGQKATWLFFAQSLFRNRKREEEARRGSG